MAKSNREGFGKLLDFWMPPKEAGEPIGCLATTFTFDPELFEEECLSRFLKMDTEFDEDLALYLIERQEKLYSVKCASVLVDQKHSNKKRSLAWDMLSMRYIGTFHPKISLLYWSGCIRLIVASANLTKPGYRENQEIFGKVDFVIEEGNILNSNAPVHVLLSLIDFLRNIILGCSLSGKAVNDRSISFLDSVQQKAEKWKSLDVKRDHNQIHLESLLIGPGRKDLFEQIQEIWMKYSSRLPHSAWITSPFYNSPDSNNLPAEKIWAIMSPKKNAKVIYSCPYDVLLDGERKYLIMAPESLKVKRFEGRPSPDISFRGNSMFSKDENGNERIRSPHLKNILIENDEWLLYMIGSSNFTSPGTGLAPRSNYEANIVYIVNKNKNPSGYDRLQASFSEDEYLEQSEIEFSQLNFSDEEGEPGIPILPLFFESCEAIWQNGVFIRFHFDKNHSIGAFRISDESGILNFQSKYWTLKQEPEFIILPWPEKPIPSGFNVYIEDEVMPAFWALNAETRKVLPTPDVLKNLKLPELIEILSSTRTLISSMRKILRDKESSSESGYHEKEYMDPHKRVDTSGYILQRTRRMSNALSALGERIARPVYTMESLEWRLNGPVGVSALCEAMAKEVEKTHLDDDMKKEEMLFFLAELTIEFANIEPVINNDSLSKTEIMDELKKFLRSLFLSHEALINSSKPSPIRDYAKKAIKIVFNT